MASEELQQKYPKGVGVPAGRYEVFETQLVTLNQFATHGIIPNVPLGNSATQKPDALVIERAPTLRVIGMAESKAPGGVTASNWKGLAKGLLEKKLRPTGAQLGWVTDGSNTYWVAGGAASVTELSRQDGLALPATVDWTDATFVAEFEYIAANLDPVTGVIRAPKNLNPEALAREVWQTVWRLQADRPEDCLATFVEIFIYKFLDDLGLMTTNAQGVNVAFGHLASGIPIQQCFAYYEANVRPHIKTMFPAGPDGVSVINGIVMQSSNRDHNIIFHEILKNLWLSVHSGIHHPNLNPACTKASCKRAARHRPLASILHPVESLVPSTTWPIWKDRRPAKSSVIPRLVSAASS